METPGRPPPPLRFTRQRPPRSRLRRALRRSRLAVPLLALGAVVSAAAILVAGAMHDSARSGLKRPVRLSAAHARAAPATTTRAEAAPPPPVVDPFRTKPMRAYLRTNDVTIGAAVEDLQSGHTFVYHPHVQQQTASIMKVDILETLLDQANATHTQLDYYVAGRAQRMIENSDNDDAQALWDAAGGSTAVAAYNTRVGLTETIPNAAGYWGISTTTAPDQLALLRQLVNRDGELDRDSRHYALELMRNVEPDQQWGISGGVPASADVALKNGWLPLSSTDWQVNSIGRVKGDGRSYIIAILTTGDPTEADGITTIERISALVWKYL
jgi:beta-lactamase class A